MSRLLVILSVITVLGLALWRTLGVPVVPQQVAIPVVSPALMPIENPAAEPLLPAPLETQQHLVFDISVHTKAELELVLQRVEALARMRQSGADDGRIALVLHGPEVAFFTRRNYDDNRELVDLAAKLSAFELIDVKMCQTMMKALDIHAADVPAFIEQVPYGPAEVEQLQQGGFVAM